MHSWSDTETKVFKAIISNFFSTAMYMMGILFFSEYAIYIDKKSNGLFCTAMSYYSCISLSHGTFDIFELKLLCLQ